MVAKNIPEVIELVKRLFHNDMQYKLEKKEGYFRLKEILTDSTIRIQTSDLFLSKSFWNYFTRHVKD
jgi:cysteinyl-tRNA synthetase